MTEFKAKTMYVRTKSTPRSKNISVQIVESQRIDGKIKQHVIRHLGTTNPGEELEKLKQLARSIIVELEHDAMRLKTSPETETLSSHFGQLSPILDNVFLKGISLEESKRVILGIHDVYGYIYDHIGFKNPFSNATRREASANILREIVMARIANPDSKRASVAILAEQFGIDLNLDHVYQMMDKIDDAFCERIQKYALAATLQLTGEKLRVLFYDATTLYFESFTEDALKKNGYSKDLKFNQPQVLLALFVTQSGLPVGYELFPGNTFEGHTLKIALNKLKERYLIDKIIFVADRGMLSDSNLHFLEDNNYQYIVGARLKSLDEEGQKNVLNWANFISEKNTDEVTHRITVIPQTKYPIKIFFNPLTDKDKIKIIKPNYVLWRENKQWNMAIYEEMKVNAIIPLSSISGLELILSQISEHKNKISRNIRNQVTDLILKYHNKPRLLVLSYRIARALKDRADREKAIQKLQLRLKRSKNPKQLISKYGFQKFIKVEGESELQIDQQKLFDEAKWDGIIGIYVSDPTLTNEEVIEHYRGLWQVEESFRIQKHDLKIRPIYHWTPQRVKAHIAISFMAFVCVRYLEYRVATQSQKLSPNRIKNILINYQASIIKDKSTDKTYLLPSNVNSELNEIYRVIGQKPSQGLKEIQL